MIRRGAQFYRNGSRFLNLFIILFAGIICGCILAFHRERISQSIGAKNRILSPPTTSIAAQLHDEVRVLCWVLTNPENHVKTKSIRETWGKRCNVLLFMTSRLDTTTADSTDTIRLDVEDGRDNLWNKTKEAFKYVYAHHFDDADWFLKVDDDAFVFVENLRKLLVAYSPEMPIHFGYKFNVPSLLKKGYYSGGPGYVMSKEAVRLFIEVGLPDDQKCPFRPTGAEDIEIGMCLEKIGVIAGDSRLDDRERFFVFDILCHFFPPVYPDDFWYYINAYYPIHDGLDCCTKDVISFHYTDPKTMYLIEYLAYTFRAFGVPRSKSAAMVPKKLTWNEVVADLRLSEENRNRVAVTSEILLETS